LESIWAHILSSGTKTTLFYKRKRTASGTGPKKSHNRHKRAEEPRFLEAEVHPVIATPTSPFPVLSLSTHLYSLSFSPLSILAREELASDKQKRKERGALLPWKELKAEEAEARRRFS
jgi:hypothetical protein